VTRGYKEIEGGRVLSASEQSTGGNYGKLIVEVNRVYELYTRHMLEAFSEHEQILAEEQVLSLSIT
jgi:hypothetical protein